MNSEQNNGPFEGQGFEGQEQLYSPIESGQPAAAPKKRLGWKIFWGIIFVLSVLGNIALFLILIGVIAFFTAGKDDILAEDVIQKGPRTSKIAMITVQGIINDQQSRDFYEQLKAAREDKHVKGVIVRVNSPGGAVSSSDQIHNEISRYREKTGEPIVAFMQGIAASGGYYISVPCDTIVAEPTTITGSVGVLMGHFVLQGLLEEKLGIQPEVVKSGLKKDWPSPFKPMTEEQRKYIEDKLISPAYERFVQLVADGRSELTLEDVKRLADGSIYGAQEALNEKMIDRIGYMAEAIEEVKSLAGLEEAQVVEYGKPFSFSSIFGANAWGIKKIDKSTLYELSAPEVLYLWDAYR